MPKIVLALLAQFTAVAVLFLIVKLLPNWVEPPYGAFWLIMGQSFLALGFTALFRMNRWWWLIQFGLPWLWYWALVAQFNPWLSLGLFVLIVLVFANAFSDRVPLYLTNSMTRKALKKIAVEAFDPYQKIRFLDIGSGLGANVFYMAQLPKVLQSTGVETAPIPLFISWVRSKLLTKFGRQSMSAGRSNFSGSSQAGVLDDFTQDESHKSFHKAQIIGQDLWKHSLSEYDFVYAFLSPEPMPKLWQKILEEMSPQALFVSNSFAVPEVEPSDIWQLSDSRQTILYFYRIADFLPAGE